MQTLGQFKARETELMLNSLIRHKWFACFLLVSAMCGCGGSSEPEVAMVEGIVTLNGQPAGDLQVSFEPVIADGKNAATVGGASSGVTDPTGKYVLNYKGGVKKGAVLGKHIVRIESAKGGGPAGGGDAVAGAPIPVAYNTESTLTAEIVKGENKKNFDIVSQ